MKYEDYARYDGLGLAELVRRREVSPAELLDAAIARMDATNHDINAVVCRLDDQARASVAAGLPAGPFTGVPYLLKDLGAHYQGAVTSFGGALFKDFVPDHDSEITIRLKRAGLVIVGKTNTPELGLGQLHRAASVRADAESMEPRPQRGRLERRLRGGRGRGRVADGARDGRRRIDPHSRVRGAGSSA